MTWKARFILNYKRIPYQTKFLSYPDIEDAMREIGAKPTTNRPDTGKPLYTLPVILVPAEDGGQPIVVEDSLKIAEFLEKKCPSPSVFPEGSRALQAMCSDWLRRMVISQQMNILAPVIPALLDERGAAYFHETRSSWFHKPLEELTPEGELRDAAWEEMKNGWGKLAEILETRQEDEWFMGKTPVFFDFELLSHAVFIHKSLPQPLLEEFMTWHGGRWARLLEKAKDYMQEH